MIYIIVGTRPNLVKISRLWHIGPVIHTNQHYSREMVDDIQDDLGIKVNHYLSGNALVSFLKQHRPDAVMVVGDVRSTLEATEISVTLGIPIIHLESGLRCREQIPEEFIRQRVDKLSNIHLCSDQCAVDNLDPGLGILVGNTMIDSLADHLDQIKHRHYVSNLGFSCPFIVVTLHRPANVDDNYKFDTIISQLNDLSQKIIIVWPIHPRIKKISTQIKSFTGQNGILTIAPQSYINFLSLVHDSTAVITDSGGLQEETSVLGVTCFTLRSDTERPWTLTQNGGTNRLIEQIPSYETIQELSNSWRPEIVDSDASQKIIRVLISRKLI